MIHKSIPPSQVHKGHRFFPRQFKVATVCEYCSKLVPLLESGEVCEGKQLVQITKVIRYTLIICILVCGISVCSLWLCMSRSLLQKDP